MESDEDAEARMVMEGIARTVTYHAWLAGEEPESADDRVRLALFVTVSAALEAVDPIGIVPDDDYDAEAADLVEHLVEAGGVPDEPELATAVVATFERWFGEGSCAPAQAAAVARHITDAAGRP